MSMVLVDPYKAGNFPTPVPLEPYEWSTVLLLKMNGVDESTEFDDYQKGRSFIAYGGAKIDTAQSKFGGSAGYFDGIDSYIKAPAQSDYRPGSEDYTIEFWMRPSAIPGAGVKSGIIGSDDISSGTRGWSIYMDGDNSGKIVFSVYVGGVQYTAMSTVAPTADTWVHVAAVRFIDNIRLYVSGTAQATTSIGASASIDNALEPLVIGSLWNSGAAASYFTGWLDDVRISKGFNRYPTNYAVPTSGLPASNDPFYSSTVLLMHLNNNWTDQKAHGFTPSGNAAFTSTYKAFGSHAATFDGNGDYSSTGDSADWDFGTSDFTVECYFRLTGAATADSSGSRRAVLFGTNAGSTGWNLYVDGNASVTGTAIRLQIKNSGVNADIGVAYSFSYGQWYHVAVTRRGTTARIFVNGVKVYEGSHSTTVQGGTGGLRLADGFVTGFRWYLYGQLDEVRITKLNRYTRDFTPQVYEFQNS